MDASNSWQNIVHTHCGLKEIENQSLNATLQILFHIPPFLQLLENGDHSCADCVFCRIQIIWECVKKGTVDINLNSGLSDILNCSDVFETMITVLTYLHHSFVKENNSDESAILEIFGGQLNTTMSCAACKTSRSIPELLLCLQVKIDCALNLQEAINSAFLSKARPCGKCSYHILIVTMLSKHPSILFVRPITSTKNNVGFRIDETIEISCNKYKIIGAILDGKKAVVRCPNSSLISIENKKIRSISWSKFLECETGEVSSILIYENITPKVNEISEGIPHHSTPVLDKTIDSEVQSTTKWSVTPIDQHQLPKSSRSKARRKLYDSPSLHSSTHKFSRSASKIIRDSKNGNSTNYSSLMRLTQGRVIYIRTVLSFKTCSNKPESFKFLTGLTVDNFRAVYNLMGGNDRIGELKMKYDQKTPKKFSSQRLLCSEDKLFMLLLRLRRGYPFEDLGYFFDVDPDYCSRVVYAVLRYLCITFQNLEKHLFISAEAQNERKPLPFRPFKNLRVIIDGFDLYIDCPSNFQQQGNTYSDYRSHNTVRFIVGISSHGGIIYVSPGYEGNMSENQMLAKSGFYDLLDEGDAVMSDRGFKNNDELLRRGVELIKPPSLGKRSQFTAEEEIRTRAIASARIYVEHAVRLIKANRLLRSYSTPLTSLGTISDYVFVAGYLANFGFKKMGKQKRPSVEK